MHKIALIGSKYLVNPLAAAGIDIAACETEREGCEKLEALLKARDHAIIFITESLAQNFMDKIEAAEEKGVNIVLLPDHKGSIGLFREKLQGLIRKAAGAVKV